MVRPSSDPSAPASEAPSGGLTRHPGPDAARVGDASRAPSGRRARASLAFKLTASLIGFQLVIFLLVLAAIAVLLSSRSANSIDEGAVEAVAQALTLDAQGRLVLADTPKTRALVRSPAFWFVARDDTGRALRVGTVPAHYEALEKQLASLTDSGISARRDAETLAARILIHDAPFGRVHLMVGGVPVDGAWAVTKTLLDVFGLRMMLPIVLVTLCVIPWLTRRTLAGVARAAKDAEAIHIGRHDARLNEQGLPPEVLPLVRAVNEALVRLSEGYDARDRFLADAAHELRAPIAILEVRVGMLEPGAARTRLMADVSRLSNLAETLLDLQRLGRKLTDLETVDLNAVAHQVASDMAPLVLDAGYEIEVNASDRPVPLAGDRLALGRAVVNLVQNAIVHGGGRGMISIDVESGGVLRVRDQGPGVPPEERERIFEPFHRIRPRDQGAGLGLHLAREIVDLHRGTIKVAEVQGGGASFEMRLPLRASPPAR